MGWFGKSDDEDDLKKRSKRAKEEAEEESEEEPEEEASEDEEETNTYTYSTTCDNCGEDIEFEIPVGTRIVDYKNSDKCEICGCKMIDPEARGQSHEE